MLSGLLTIKYAKQQKRMQREFILIYWPACSIVNVTLKLYDITNRLNGDIRI